MTTPLQRTVLCARHKDLGAQMVPFGGWEMPVQYPAGILQEHLATRRKAGLFDVSHMGRFIVGGRQAIEFIQHVLTNNAAALEIGMSQYTLIADDDGGAVDDAYLYRFFADAFLLVVNAANRQKDWDHLQGLRAQFKDVTLEDHTHEIAMLSLQGPQSKTMLAKLLDSGTLPEPQRNALSLARCGDAELWLARTGYTGEPLCFELFIPVQKTIGIWDRLLDQGAQPVGLGARDTLRLEAGLPLYGHELGLDPEQRPIPIFAIPLARFAVSFSALKGDFIGKQALWRQYQALKCVLEQRAGSLADLPRRIRTVELLDKGIARAGALVLYQDRPVGHITSGTMVPYYKVTRQGIHGAPGDETGRRAIALALIDSRIPDGAKVAVEVRGKNLQAGIMPYLLRSEAPPQARAITWQDYTKHAADVAEDRPDSQEARQWIQKAIDNTIWRQRQCINLIPSEQSPSPVVRMLTIMDPMCRYAEHKSVKAFAEAEVFYYQGTDFIAAVEQALAEQMRLFLGCRQVETRPVSGQMANMVVFSALIDFINRADRKSEQRRLRQVMNHHIIKGGHLSAQPMGALRDFVRRDPQTERPAVVNFPVLPQNPFDVDLPQCAELLARHKPELIILGKSMILHKEPVAAIRKMVDELGLDTLILYDMAHVLGLAGPFYQHPFAEGADLVTGSTHKTFFGTQRGVVAASQSSDFPPDQGLKLELWEAIERRAFPGAVSNHHLGTLLGLLVAAMEMNAFKDRYPAQVVANAKAFAKALHACGLEVAGDPAIDFTETHQVIVSVGYAKGPRIARLLEENNIVCNYQALPAEEGFTASGALRLGVSEMTRYGMQEEAFERVAQFMADVILRQQKVKDEVQALRQEFQEMQFCFKDQQMQALMEKIHRLV